VALVRSVLDLAANALPMGLERAVALDDHLKTKAERRIANRFLAERMDSPVDVLSHHRGLELLDAHEILVIERSEPLDGDLQVRNQLLELRLLHSAAPYGNGTTRTLS